MANGLFGGGNGTTTAPYLVEDAADLQAITSKLSVHFKQIKDIDMTGATWKGIGSDSTPFTGTYEGQGFKIKNLYRKITEKDSTTTSQTSLGGVFNAISAPSIVQNIYLENLTVECLLSAESRSYMIGGVVGWKYKGSNLRNITVDGLTITADKTVGNHTAYIYIGGIVCRMDSRDYTGVPISDVRSCIVTNATITGSSRLGTCNIAGICESSYNYNTLEDCHFSGTITNAGTYPLTYGIGRAWWTIDCTVTNSTIENTASGTSGGNVATASGVDAIRCHVSNTTMKTNNGSVSGIIIYTNDIARATNCSIIDSVLIAEKGHCSGISLNDNTSSNSWYTSYAIGCLSKNVSITGTLSASGLALGANSAADVKDSACLGSTIVATNGDAGGIGRSGANSRASIVNRCIFSGNVTCKGAHLGGLLATPTTASYVANSFFLGDFIKGLGAITINSGRISSLALSSNSNNYSLDSSQLILE